MEASDCGDAGRALDTDVGEKSNSHSHDAGECSSLNTENCYDEPSVGSREVVQSSVVSEVDNTGLSSSVTDSLSNDTAGRAEQKTDESASFEGSQADNELSQKILTQVEYYFSDENLVKDSFLMQRINRDKRGYVDLKLIASFKKMKKLTRDINIIAAALRNSSKLEVNKAGTMVRRIAALPVTNEEAAALKTVVAVNFSESGNLAEQFGSCGTVTRVRIVSKDDTVPSDVRKHLKRSLVDGGRAATAMAFIEYDDNRCAQAACENLTDSSDWRHGLHVSMLVPKSLERKSSSNKFSPVKDGNASDVKSLPPEPIESETQSSRIKKKANRKNQSRVEAILKGESAGYSSSGSETEGQEEPKVSGSKRRPQRAGSPRGGSSPVGYSNFAQSVLAHNKISLVDDLHGEARSRSGSTGAIEYGSRGISPWVQRRLQAAQHQSKSAESSVTDLSAGDSVSPTKPPEVITVLRQPRGPDGTRGFNLLR